MVICNSRHHSVNTLILAEHLIALERNGNVLALCTLGEEDYFESYCEPKKTRVLPFSRATVEALGCAEVDSSDKQPDPNVLLYFIDRIYHWISYLRTHSKLVIVRLLIDFMVNTTIGSILQQHRVKKNYIAQVSLAKQILNAYNPSVILCMGDRHIDFELPVLTAARSAAVRIVIPYVSYSGAAGMVKIRAIQGGYRRWLPLSLYRLIAGLLLRSQLREGFYCQKPTILMALRGLGMLSSNPWCIGNGFSDIVCVDNAATVERYVKEGVERSKLIVVGDTAYDALLTSYLERDLVRKRMVCAKSIDAGRKTIILALPQFAEQGLLSWSEHWCEIHHLLAAVSVCDCNVVVSLHPRVDRNDYNFLENRYPIRFATQSLKEILPIADLFIAVNSSTVFWSVLCGIPVIVLDYFDLDTSQFDSLQSLIYVRDRNSIGKVVIDTLLRPPLDFAADWQSLSRDEVFDGRVTSRYHEIVKA